MTAAVSDRRALLSELEQLVSEERNPRTMGIDLMATPEIVKTINAEDRLVPEAVGKTLPQVAQAVDKIVEAFGKGGRLVYIGAGTSGRLGVLDASECPPTFGVPPDLIIGKIAGGSQAMTTAIEGAEDSFEMGQADVADLNIVAEDTLVGITASGRTPY